MGQQWPDDDDEDPLEKRFLDEDCCDVPLEKSQGPFTQTGFIKVGNTQNGDRDRLGEELFKQFHNAKIGAHAKIVLAKMTPVSFNPKSSCGLLLVDDDDNTAGDLIS